MPAQQPHAPLGPARMGACPRCPDLTAQYLTLAGWECYECGHVIPTPSWDAILAPKPHWLEPLGLSDLLELMQHLVRGHRRVSQLYIYSIGHGIPAEDVGSTAEELHNLVSDVYARFSDLNGSEAIL